eukprot:TRINITY_DN79497_c0_g1_i1.p1 TRINITY_DN79497_c0_g1~~TRINITY_DN79497_c0_g1_i1.p1  ORF type:complete len:306 (+),score=78.58 TRINITY_DN79497_c0_g1_i1:81-998(+)
MTDLTALAHRAIDLSKYNAFDQLFDWLEDQKEQNNIEFSVLVNTRPSVRKFAILHQAAWWGNQEAVHRLLEDFEANPNMLTGDGELASEVAADRGFDQLADHLRAVEAAGRDRKFDGKTNRDNTTPVTVSVLLMSGKMVLKEACFKTDDQVQKVKKKANKKYIKGDGDSYIINLVAENGELLKDSSTISDAGLADGCNLTAVIGNSLEKIEEEFHKLILWRVRAEDKAELESKNFTFPDLKELAEKGCGWFAVPGMYGGFDTRLGQDELDNWRLTCSSWSRICEGSEQTHEITVYGTKLLSSGAC